MGNSKFVNRGGVWVALQIVLLALIVLIPIYTWLTGSEVGWGWPLGSIASLLGIMSLVLGVMFFRQAISDLGRNLTPYPKPLNKGELVQTGVYGMVRHPIYTAAVLLALGWALVFNSVLAAIGAFVLFVFFDAKASREEKWLMEKYAGYAAYRKRVKKLLPGVY